MRVVVIDDEYRTRSSLIKLIHKLFQEIEVIGEEDNGIDGMKLIRSLQPDLVITDIKMPQMDGLEMIDKARQTSLNTYFLILSGYAEFELAQKALKLSVVDYLLKPVTVSQLEHAIRLIMGKIQERTAQSILPEKKADTEHQDKSGYSFIVSYIIKDIDLNYSQKLYLENYAEKLHITPEYTSNLFRKETGMNFTSYLRLYRIEKAKEMLKSSDVKIFEVAYLTGFTETKYFCKVFKEITGISAKNYQRNSRI